MSRGASRAVPLVGAVLTVLLLASVGYSVWADHRWVESVTTEGDVAQAATIVADHWQAGDAVTMQPWWFSTGRALFASVGGGIAPPFKAFDFKGVPDPLALMPFKRLWVVAVMGTDIQEVIAKYPATYAVDHIWSDVAPTVQVALLIIPPSTIVRSYTDDLASAEVVRKDAAGKKTLCPWKGSYHDCPGPEWRDVTMGNFEVGDETRQCVYVEPWPNNGTVVIAWPPSTLSDTLVLQTGFTISGVRKADGADTKVQLLVGGEVVHEHVEYKNDFTWTTYNVDVSKSKGASLPVALHVSSPKSGWRQLCFVLAATDGPVDVPVAGKPHPGKSH